MATGLAKVHRNIIDGLVEAGADVSPCAWYAHTAAEITTSHKNKTPLPKKYYDSNGKKIEIYHLSKDGYGALVATFEALEALRPDVVVTSGDYWDLFYMQAVKRQLNFSFKWVFYATIEQANIPEKWLPLFQYVDVLACPSLYGQRTMERAGIPAKFIPYGTDDCFRPAMPDKRAELRKKKGLGDGDFRVITVGQNTSRKYLPMVMMVANALKANPSYKGNVKFHIHTNVTAMDKSETYLFSLQEIAEKLGVQDMITYPDAHSIFDGCPIQALMEEYQASDAFLSTSLSEGYHLPLVEAMACGLPCISNATTTAFEHLGTEESPDKGGHAAGGVGKRGLLCQSSLLVFPPDRVTRIMDPYDAGSAILELMAAPDMATDMASACTRYGQSRTWKAMRDELLPLILNAPKKVTIPVEEI